MIRSFRDNEAALIWSGQGSQKLPPDIQQTARRKLRMINNAARLDDLRVPPGNRLEALKGARRGEMSVRINSQWRICFEWRDGAAENVEITDYHG